jgi:hypothetical protein
VDFLGLMRVKNEEEFIAEVLEAQWFCEKIIVLNNYSTDRTAEIARRFKNVEVVDTPFPDVYDEGKDQEYLCELARNYWPRWICRMQGDEVLERDTYKKLEPLINRSDVECIEVHSLNYWNDTKTLRVDGAVGQGFRQSFWRFPKGIKLTYDFMHCSLPQQLASIPKTQIGLAMWHYGFMSPARRAKTAAIQKAADRDKLNEYRWNTQGDPGGAPVSENITGEPLRLQSVDEFLIGKPYSRRAREYND